MIHGKLLPVIPRMSEGEDLTRRATRPENVVHLLEKYGQWLADTVICFEQTDLMVEAVLGAGKKVVPAITGDRTELTLRWSDGDDNAWKMYVEWVLDNVDRWEGVQLGNVILEVSNCFCPNEPTESVIHRLLDKFPTLVGKLVLGPFHEPDLARDMATEGFPVRAALLEAGPWHTVYWGYELLKESPAKMIEWLGGVPCYSGVNYSAGAADHNLNRLMDAGFAGGLFFLPAHDMRFADMRMEQYLTDVR